MCSWSPTPSSFCSYVWKVQRTLIFYGSVQREEITLMLGNMLEISLKIFSTHLIKAYVHETWWVWHLRDFYENVLEWLLNRMNTSDVQ